LPKDVFRSFGFPGVEELAIMLEAFDSMSEGTLSDRRTRDIEWSRGIFHGEDWEAYLRRSKWMQ